MSHAKNVNVLERHSSASAFERRNFVRSVTTSVFGMLLLANGLCGGFPGTACYGQESAIQPGQVNVEFSRIYTFVEKTGVIGHQHAVEGRVQQGLIYLSSTKLGSLVFDMSSFEADTETARKYLGLEGTNDESTKKQVSANMLGANILNVKKYPQARFEHIRVQPHHASSSQKLPEYLLTGDFTLHDKTLPIEIMADLEKANGWNHLRGSFKILQSSYGIKPFTKMLGTIGITDELTIHGDLWIAPE